MNGFEAYKTFLAVKRHFEPGNKYDFFKYHGKINAKEETYQKRRDRYFFEKLSKKYGDDVLEFLVSNALENNLAWIGKTLDEGEEIYQKWKKRRESLSYHVKEQLTFLSDYCMMNDLTNDDLIIVTDTHPPLLKMLLSKELSYETVIVLDEVLNFKPYWDKRMCDDIIYSDVSSMLDAYRKFVTFDKEQCKKIVRDVLL